MKPTPQAIENAARALCRAMCGNEQYLSEYYASHAEAVLSCDLGDMVLVPKEPTETVLDRAVSFALRIAIDGDYRWRDYMRDLYRAMIAAAEGERCK